jgi:hypothetical protein
LQLLDVLAYSAQIPWERVKVEIAARCRNFTLPLGVVAAQLADEIRAGAWFA